MHFIFAAGLALSLNAAGGQAEAQAQAGYVIRVDCDTVILDFNEKSGAAAGQSFVVFKEGEELKHPATGESLGRLEVKVAEGYLKEILSRYSVGALLQNDAWRTVAAGMRARLKPMAALAAPAPQQTAAGPAGARVPRWRGPAFDYPATAMAVADCQGDGKLVAAVSDGLSVYVYPYPPRDAKPVAEFPARGTAARILSLEALDLNGDGRAEIFATLFNDAFSRFETIILDMGANGELRKAGEIPYLVRGYQDFQGVRRLAAQQITDDSSFPFGAVYPLVYQEGKYVTGRPALKFVKRPVDWLYDFTFAAFDGQPATVSLTNTDLVRVQFSKGSSWKTSESYCQTPNRVRWAGERMLQFRPALAARSDGKGGASLYAVKNIAALGGLAGPFGIFSRAELHRLDWNGLSLAPSWSADLGGYSTALDLVSPPGGAQELAVMVVSSAGKSSIWAFDP